MVELVRVGFSPKKHASCPSEGEVVILVKRRAAKVAAVIAQGWNCNAQEGATRPQSALVNWSGQ